MDPKQQIKINRTKLQDQQDSTPKIPFTDIRKGNELLVFNHQLASSSERKTGRRWMGPLKALKTTETNILVEINGKRKWVSRHFVKRFWNREKAPTAIEESLEKEEHEIPKVKQKESNNETTEDELTIYWPDMSSNSTLDQNEPIINQQSSNPKHQVNYHSKKARDKFKSNTHN